MATSFRKDGTIARPEPLALHFGSSRSSEKRVSKLERDCRTAKRFEGIFAVRLGRIDDGERLRHAGHIVGAGGDR